MLSASPQIHTPADEPVDQSVLDREARSVGHMFRDRINASPDRPAYLHAVVTDSGDQWVTVTWAELDVVVREIGAGLIALGIEPEDRVAIASSTRYEWALADLAVMVAGGATTTIYPTTMADDVVVHRVRLRGQGHLRRERRAAREAARHPGRDPRGAAGHRLRRGVRRRRVDPHPRRGAPARPRVPRGRPRRDRRPHRRHRARPARHDHLHLGHDRPPQGRAAAAQRLDLRGRRRRVDRTSSARTTCSTSGCRWPTSSARCCSPCRCRSASPRPSTAGSTRSSTTSPS